MEPVILQRWREKAACQDEDMELFFPEALQGRKAADPEPAKRICGRCPVREQCLDYAIEAPERYGVWGGVAEQERAHERRKRMRRAANRDRADAA